MAKVKRRTRKNVTRTETFNAYVKGSRKRVYDLMKDRKWHDREEIQVAAGVGADPASEGLRRMRELRKFFTIETRLKDSTTRLYEYRLSR